jgi:hypothetical protein
MAVKHQEADIERCRIFCCAVFASRYRIHIVGVYGLNLSENIFLGWSGCVPVDRRLAESREQRKHTIGISRCSVSH